MNFDIIQGNWSQFTGKIKEKYADLTDDEIMGVEASAEKLSGLLQEKYGWTKEEAEDHLKEIEDEMSS